MPDEPDEIEKQIAQSLSVVESLLGEALLGVYLYGSSVVGGLQKYSDIDLLVVSGRSTTREEKARLVARMLTISCVDENSPRRPIELTIVVEGEIKPWHYPPTFDFQYGDWLRKAFEAGNIEPWSSKIMPDLALLITQVRLASKTLLGPAPDQLLDAVPYRDFMTASVKELDSLMADLSRDTRNVLLTLARIWSTVETDAIRSKPDAAAWILNLNRLPAAYQPVMRRARAICVGEEPEHWSDIEALVQPCADFMVDRIKAQMSQLESPESAEDANRSIKLAEPR
jgi:streptomycin 3"-adenylyltransferase